MIKFRILYSWIIIAIVAQCAVLLVVDIYIPRRGVGKAILEEYENVLGGKNKINVKLDDENIKDIKISYNGEYISYTSNSELCIYSISEKKTIARLSDQGRELVIAKWLPDRSIIMYTFKTKDNEAGQVKLMTYNADIGKERYYEDIITGLTPGSYVTSLNFSPKTNVVYLNVKVGDNIAYLYKYNIMDYLYWIANTTPNMVIKQTYQTDHYIYSPYPQGLTIQSGYTGVQYNYHFEDEVYILGCNFEDNVYFALLNDEGKVYEIRYGKYDEGEWNTIAMEYPVEKEDIFFSLDVKPYYIDSDNNEVIDLLDGNRISYDAKEEDIIEILEGHLVTKRGAEVVIKRLKGDLDD